MATESTTPSRPSRAELAVVAISIGWFILAGFLLIPHLGVENDEALFANGIYAPERMPGRFNVFGRTVPTMVMPYVGALKTWVYALVFSIFPPTVWSLRLPVLLGGAVVIWIVYRLLRHIGGARSAVIGCVLLATDVTFVLTVAFDRGPVLPQLLLLVAGMMLAVRFHDTRRLAYLAGAFFLFGLALWDKAVFLWTGFGLGAATVIVLLPELRRVLNPRTVAVATGAFLLGALPFVAYNVKNGFGTFQGRRYSLEDRAKKIAVMRASLSGTALKHYMIDLAGTPAEPSELSVAESTGLSLNGLPHPSAGLLPFALAAAVLFLPWTWNRPGARALPFFAIAFLVPWLIMMAIVGAGGSSHHTILLWPQLLAFISVALGLGAERMPKLFRGALMAGVLAVAAANVFVWSDHYAGLIRLGPARLWTEAIHPLVSCVREVKPKVVFAADWGMDFSLRMFLEGDPPIEAGIGLFPPKLDKREREFMERRFSRQSAVFVSYVDGKEVFPDGKRLIQQYADEEGYRKEILCQPHDRRGRPFFEVYRYEPD